MSTPTVFTFHPDGTHRSTTLHPEVVDPSREVFRRDRRLLRRHRTTCLVREPYDDLQEVETAMALAGKKPSPIVAVLVQKLDDEKNMRTFFTAEQLQHEVNNSRRNWQAVASKGSG